MGSVPFAFSVHQFVSSVGSDAGFASIVGLAILVLLYFAQARETASLREQAYEAGQRVEQLEARVAQLARQPAAPAPPPASAPAAAAAGPATRQSQAVGAGAAAARAKVPAGVGAALPGAPAGVAAPALSAATRLIPVAVPRPAGNGPGPGPAPPQPADQNAGTPAPATAAGAVNGAARDPVVPAPVGARAAAGPAGPRAAGQSSRPSPRPAAAKDGPRRPFLPPPRAQRGRSRFGRVMLALLGLLVAGAIVAALLIVTSSGNQSHSISNASRTTNAPSPARQPVRFNPGSVTVAVLNGTATPGLAGRTSHQLVTDGYKQGAVATATDQTRTATAIAYLPGYRSDALRVAAALKLSKALVQSIDQSARAVACPPPAACTANVVVTVGSDLTSP